MAGFDSDIFFRQKSPDIMGAVQGGLKMRDMLDQKKKQGQLDEAYKVGGGDAKKTMSELASRGFGKESMEMAEKSQAMDANAQKMQKEKQMYSIDMISRVAPTIKDQGSYEAALAQLGKSGIDVSTMPQAYDPGLVNRYTSMALSAKEKMDQEFRQQQLAGNREDRQIQRAEQRMLQGFKQDEKMQGLQTPYGLANTVDDAKNLKSAHESKQNFDNKIQQMIELREKHSGGAVMNREDVARGKQLSKDLLLMYKDMAKLGVLSAADEKILNAIIPEDPLEYNSPLAAIQGQDPTLQRLKSFQVDSNTDFKNRVGTRTREGLKNASKAPKSYDQMSDDELLNAYNEKVKGTKNAQSR